MCFIDICVMSGNDNHSLCLICNAKKPQVMFEPCNDIVSCSKCTIDLDGKNCPKCDLNINKCLRLEKRPINLDDIVRRIDENSYLGSCSRINDESRSINETTKTVFPSLFKKPDNDLSLGEYPLKLNSFSNQKPITKKMSVCQLCNKAIAVGYIFPCYHNCCTSCGTHKNITHCKNCKMEITNFTREERPALPKSFLRDSVMLKVCNYIKNRYKNKSS
ncbi:E3 ubiquitin-protein ligase mib1-like isoform X2 [Daktulosphaira vitifoliae]|nr:E3 ubiquitin-protein ligase mib1-like isoform X2 [Daktulosphaira vitifoliae]